MPPEISSGFNWFFLALSARSFTFLASPTKFSWSAWLMTGTIRLPLGKAVAIPILMLLLTMILSPSMDEFTMGKSLNALATASIKGKVSFSPSLLSKSFLYLFSIKLD